MMEKVISIIAKATGVTLIAIFAGLSVLSFIRGESDFLSELFEKIGTIAEIGAIAAFSLWVIRLGVIEMKKRKYPFVKQIQILFRLLHKHHILIGWAVFSAAIAHGSYFFLQTSEEAGSIYSGIAAFVALSILILIGLALKTRKLIKNKKLHQFIALLFAVALGVHLLFG